MAYSHLLILGAVLAAAAATNVEFQQCIGGSNTSLSFDFTPNFSTSNLKTMVYYEGQDFKGLGDSNGCLYTTCPTAAGVSQTFDYNLYIGHKLPTGTFAISWKVWNKDNDAQVCCFVIEIKLKKSKNVK